MVAKMELASAYVTLNVSTKTMGKQIGRMFGQVEGQASASGKRMGKSIQKGLDQVSGKSIKALQEDLAAGEAKLAAETERGRRKVEAATRKVEIAEARLSEVKGKSGATTSQVLRAEDQLQNARYRLNDATDEAKLKTAGYQKQVDEARAALDRASATSKTAGSAMSSAMSSAGSAVRSAFAGVGSAIGSSFSWGASMAQSALSTIRGAASVAASGISSVFSGVGALLKNVFTGNFSGAFDQIVAGAKTAGGAVSTAFSNVWGGFRSGLANARSSITSTASGMVSSFTGAASSTGEAVRGGLSRGFEGVKTVASRSAAENFKAFTSGAGRAASTVGNALSGGFRATVGAARSAAVNGASALTSAFSKAGSAISSGVSRSLSSLSSIAGRVGAEAGQSMTNGIMAKMKGLPAMIGGLVGLGGAGAILSSGFNRLMDLQKSDIVFKNLGLSSKQTAGLMDKLNKAVTGTSVSLSDASKNASLLMQSGVKLGPELDASTKALTNLAAASGASATEIGTIMTQIKASGQLYAGDALQLMQRGIPVYSYLAKSMGKTTDEVKKLGSEGKISYEDFVKAVNENTGDLAKEMGQTLPAKIGIMKTAFASFGAELIKPFIGPLTQAVDAITGVLKNTITPAIKQFSEWLNSGSASAEWFKSVVIALGAGITVAAIAVGAFLTVLWAYSTALKIGAAAMKVFGAAQLTAFGWIGVAVAALALLVAGFVLAYNKIGWFKDGVNAVWSGVKAVIAGFVEWWTGTAWPAIQTGLEAIGRGFNWLWQNVIVPAWNGIVTAAKWAWDSILKPIFTAIAWMITDFVGPVFTWLWQSIIVPAWNAIVQIAQWAWENVLKPIFTDISNFVRDVVGPVFSWLWENAFKPAWGAISTAISWAWENVIKPVFGFIVAILQNVVGPVFQWLLDFVVVPVFQGIGLVILAAWEIIKGVFTVLGWIIQNVLAPVFVWLWQSVIVPVWNGIAAVITWAWNSIIKPTWDAITWFINAVLVPVFQWLGSIFSLVWNAIVAVLQWAWNAAILPVWTAIKGFIDNVLIPGFQYLGSFVSNIWNWIVQIISWAWNSMVKPTWTALKWFIDYILIPGFQWLGTFINNIWNWIVQIISWAWNVAIKPIWDAIKWFIDNILIPAFNWLANRVKAAWDFIGSVISSTWNWIRDTVLNPMGNFLQNNVVDFFTKTKDGIENVWNKVKDVAKKPVGFVIDTIIKDGLIGNYNNIADKLGVGKIEGFKGTAGIKGWATGGYTGKGRKYDEAGVVHKDEYVLRKESTNKIRQEHGLSSLDYLNATGDLEGAYRMSGKDEKRKGSEHGIAAGPGSPTYGGLPSFGNPLQYAIARAGALNVKGSVDGSWNLGAAATVWNGMAGVKIGTNLKGDVPTVHARQVSGAPWAGYYDQSGIRLNIGQGWADPRKARPIVAAHEVGHALGLPHSMGTGGGASIMDYGTMYGLKGPTDKDAKALQSIYPGGSGKGGGDAGSGGINPLAWILDHLKDKFKKAFPKAAAFVDLSWGMGEKIIKEAIAKFDVFSDDGGEGGPVPEGSVKDWMTKALKMKNMFSEANLSLGVRRAMQESGGNPRAVNNWDSNAKKGTPSKGLMQTIEPTFRAYMEPGHGDIWNPIDNILASINYTMRQYGSLQAGWGRAGGYADGGLVTAPKLFDGGGVISKGIQFIDHQREKPDYVLTHEQWRAMYTIAENSASKGQGMVINGGIHGYTAEEVGREVMKQQKRREALYA